MSIIDITSKNNEVATLVESMEAKPDYQSQQHTSTQTVEIKGVKEQLRDAGLATLGSVLVIIRVTIIFILALLADTLIIATIKWSFGSIINQYPFAATLLEGIQLLSALGTAVAYIFYLVRSLFKDAKDILKELQ